MKHQDALDQLARETARAKRRLALERGLRATLPLLLAIAAWAAIALVGLHGMLPLLLQSLSAVVALALFVWLGARARRAWRSPTEDEARARLAADSRLDLGAFEALRDRPSRYDEFSVALWRREQDQAIARAEHAKAGPPRPRLDDLDPYKTRYALLLALVAALLVAGANAPDRLANAFIPDPGPLLGDKAMAVEAWATPADYTHSAPISLSDRLGRRIETPPSVEATVRVTGPTGAPCLVFDGAAGHRSVRFTHAADGAWEAHLALPGPGVLKIVRFHTRGWWRMAPTPDLAPRAHFTAPLATLTDERVTISWSAADDFGVHRLLLRVTPARPPPGLRHASPVDTEIEIPAGDPKAAEGETQVDLADHPYAGMEVEARLVAVDALGQEGASTALRSTLPEKIFLQPLARAAIEIRRHILTDRRPYRGEPAEPKHTIPAGDILLGNQRIELRDYERRPSLQRAPEGVRYAARLIDALTMEPRDGYFRDLAVFIGFRQARSELAASRTIDQTNVAANILWRTALRAEYGGAADARLALDEAQRALTEAIRSGAPQERQRQLMESLRRATDNYLNALVNEALRNGQRQNAEDTQEQTSISQDDINDLLQRVQQAQEAGRNQEAQALLQQLASILSNLDARLDQSQSQQSQDGDQDQQMQQSMDQLNQQIGQQRALNDDTRQQQQDDQQQQAMRQQSQGGGGGTQQQNGQGGMQLADRQSQIQQGLSEAQRMAQSSGAGESQDLNAAGQEMRQAENALRRGDLQGAEAAQDAALDHLRQGAEQLANEIRENGREAGEGGQTGQGSRDPLGRALNGGGDGNGNTRVPTQMDRVHAREILDEIRQRAQDPNRPEAEREYLRRLLDRFGDS